MCLRAAETGVIMLIYLDHAYRERGDAGLLRDRADVDAAVEQGAVARAPEDDDRDRDHGESAADPVEAGDGRGCHEAHRRPDGGGMLSSTVLTLVVIPAVYSLWKEREVLRRVREAPRGGTADPDSLASPGM